MTREETEKAIKVMQDYVNGKEVEYRIVGKDDWYNAATPCWDWTLYDYRVKPEPKVRPYTFEELCEAVKKHGALVRLNKNYAVYSMVFFDRACLNLGSCEEYESYEDFANNYKWLDDNSPCGVVE